MASEAAAAAAGLVDGASENGGDGETGDGSGGGGRQESMGAQRSPSSPYHE